MKKVNVKFLSDCRGVVFNWGIEKEIMFGNERDFVEDCLLEFFGGDEDELIEFWSYYCGCESLDEVISEVIENKEGNRYWVSDEGYVEVIEI